MRFAPLLMLLVGLQVSITTNEAMAQRGSGGGYMVSQAEEDPSALPRPKRPKDKFPGVGNIDSWKTSLPEWHAGLDEMREKRWDEAIAHFRASISLYQYQPKAWLSIGKCIEAKGGLVGDQENCYREALKLDSQSWRAWQRLANLLYEQKRYRECREALGNALNLNIPPKARQALDKMVIDVNSAQKDASTTN